MIACGAVSAVLGIRIGFPLSGHSPQAAQGRDSTLEFPRRTHTTGQDRPLSLAIQLSMKWTFRKAAGSISLAASNSDEVLAHATEVHWRAKKLASDWTSFKYQVRRWQDNIALGWSEDNVATVARYLNGLYYQFPIAHTKRTDDANATPKLMAFEYSARNPSLLLAISSHCVVRDRDEADVVVSTRFGRQRPELVHVRSPPLDTYGQRGIDDHSVSTARFHRIRRRAGASKKVF
jgi:hypothetical protein